MPLQLELRDIGTALAAYVATVRDVVTERLQWAGDWPAERDAAHGSATLRGRRTGLC
jgi:hypothetical protein